MKVFGVGLQILAVLLVVVAIGCVGMAVWSNGWIALRWIGSAVVALVIAWLIGAISEFFE